MQIEECNILRQRTQVRNHMIVLTEERKPFENIQNSMNKNSSENNDIRDIFPHNEVCI